MQIFATKASRISPVLFLFFLCLSANAVRAQQDNRHLTEREMQTQGTLIEADKFRLIGFCDKAIPLYEEVLHNMPKETAAMYGMARCYQEQGETENALRWYKEAIKHQPDNPWYRRYLIELLDRQGAYAQAASQAGQLLQIAPDNPEYYYLSAYYQARSGAYDQALKTLDRLEKRIGPSYELLERRYLLLLDQGALKKAEKTIKDYLSKRPEDVSALYLLADLYRKTQNWKKARQVYENILQLSPHEKAAEAGLAEVQRHAGGDRTDKASPAEMLQTLFADSHYAYEEKIKAFIPFVQEAFNKQDPIMLEQGIALARDLTARYPEEASAHAALADLLYGAGRYPEARDAYSRALERKPGVHSVWVNYLDVLQQLGAYRKLSEEAEKALDYFPNDWSFYYLAGRASLATGEISEAISWLREALPLSGKDAAKQAQTLSMLSIAYALAGNEKNSKQSLQQLQKLFGESPLWYYTSASLSLIKGENLAEALNRAQAAVEQAPENPDFLLLLARLLEKNGQGEKAQPLHQKAKQIGGGWCPEN